MSKREKNKQIEKASFLTSNNFNTSIPIIISPTTINNIYNNININKIKLILESHNKGFHKRSRSTYQNNTTSKNPLPYLISNSSIPSILYPIPFHLFPFKYSPSNFISPFS